MTKVRIGSQFNIGTNSRIYRGKLGSVPSATQIDPGLMTKEDFCKLEALIVPPPSISLTSNNCGTKITGGVISFVAGDPYIKVDSFVRIKQNEDGTAPPTYSLVPIKIHDNTYGIRFSLDIDRLSFVLTRNNKLRIKGATGEKGIEGDQGERGEDYILSGPRGKKGPTGSTPAIENTLQIENIDTVPVGATGITNIQPLVNNDGTYDLIVTRQPLGNPNVSTNKINTANRTPSWWAVVVQNPGAARVPYYLDLEGLVNSIHTRATGYTDTIRKGYEDAVHFWIQTMSDLFDCQKSALCCALERCESRKKNLELQRHWEATAAAAKPDYAAIIRPREEATFTSPGTGVLRQLYDDLDCNGSKSECGSTNSGGGGGGGGGGILTQDYTTQDYTTLVATIIEDFTQVDRNKAAQQWVNFLRDMHTEFETVPQLNVIWEAVYGTTYVVPKPTNDNQTIISMSRGFSQYNRFLNVPNSNPPTLAQLEANWAERLDPTDPNSLYLAPGWEQFEQDALDDGEALPSDQFGNLVFRYNVAVNSISFPRAVFYFFGAINLNYADENSNLTLPNDFNPIRNGTFFLSTTDPTNPFITSWINLAKRQLEALGNTVIVFSGTLEEIAEAKFEEFTKWVDTYRNVPSNLNSVLKTQRLSSLQQDAKIGKVIEVDAKNNISHITKAKSLDLAAGKYEFRIIDSNAFVDGGYRADVSIVRKKGMSSSVTSFLNKGSYESAALSLEAYFNETLVLDHSGGLIKFYFNADDSPDSLNSGSTKISIREITNPNQT